uniref:RNA-directed RNA polymerase n=1 Tax=Heterosiphonia pulchra toti-like virus TaxID=2933116 RepID=A0A9C7LLN3_9VIRU|nr:RNA-dependent RNA polymerase [Heterosiphonia pulchra toti-like virus]CAI5383927.1 RNA-dependent RNA polymerase [Heterosiphonia pulchra toti-like virus]
MVMSSVFLTKHYTLSMFARGRKRWLEAKHEGKIVLVLELIKDMGHVVSAHPDGKEVSLACLPPIIFVGGDLSLVELTTDVSHSADSSTKSSDTGTSHSDGTVGFGGSADIQNCKDCGCTRRHVESSKKCKSCGTKLWVCDTCKQQANHRGCCFNCNPTPSPGQVGLGDSASPGLMVGGASLPADVPDRWRMIVPGGGDVFRATESKLAGLVGRTGRLINKSPNRGFLARYMTNYRRVGSANPLPDYVASRGSLSLASKEGRLPARVGRPQAWPLPDSNHVVSLFEEVGVIKNARVISQLVGSSNSADALIFASNIRRRLEGGDNHIMYLSRLYSLLHSAVTVQATGGRWRALQAPQPTIQHNLGSHWGEVAGSEDSTVMVPNGWSEAMVSVLMVCGSTTWPVVPELPDTNHVPHLHVWQYPEGCSFEVRTISRRIAMDGRVCAGHMTVRNIVAAIDAYVGFFRLGDQWSHVVGRGVLSLLGGDEKGPILPPPAHMADILYPLWTAGSEGVSGPIELPLFAQGMPGRCIVMEGLKNKAILKYITWCLYKMALENFELRGNASSTQCNAAGPLSWPAMGMQVGAVALSVLRRGGVAALSLFVKHADEQMRPFFEACGPDTLLELIMRATVDGNLSAPDPMSPYEWDLLDRPESVDIGRTVLEQSAFSGVKMMHVGEAVTALEIAKMSMLGLINDNGFIPETGPSYPINTHDIVALPSSACESRIGRAYLGGGSLGLEVEDIVVENSPWPQPIELDLAGLLPDWTRPIASSGPVAVIDELERGMGSLGAPSVSEGPAEPEVQTREEVPAPPQADKPSEVAQAEAPAVVSPEPEGSIVAEEQQAGREDGDEVAGEKVAAPEEKTESGKDDDWVEYGPNWLPDKEARSTLVTLTQALQESPELICDAPEHMILIDVKANGQCGPKALAISAEAQGLTGKVTTPEYWAKAAGALGLSQTERFGWWCERVFQALSNEDIAFANYVPEKKLIRRHSIAPVTLYYAHEDNHYLGAAPATVLPSNKEGTSTDVQVGGASASVRSANLKKIANLKAGDRVLAKWMSQLIRLVRRQMRGRSTCEQIATLLEAIQCEKSQPGSAAVLTWLRLNEGDLKPRVSGRGSIRMMSKCSLDCSSIEWGNHEVRRSWNLTWRLLLGLGLSGPRWETGQEMTGRKDTSNLVPEVEETTRSLPTPVGGETEKRRRATATLRLALKCKPGLKRIVRRSLREVFPPLGKVEGEVIRQRFDLSTCLRLLGKRHPGRAEQVIKCMADNAGSSGLFWSCVAAWGTLVADDAWAIGWIQLAASTHTPGCPHLKAFNERLLALGHANGDERPEVFNALLGLSNFGAKAYRDADWAEERRVLEQPPPTITLSGSRATRADWSKLIADEIAEMWDNEAAKRKVRNRQDWWADRANWTVAGSAAGAGSVLNTLKSLKGVVKRPSKQEYVECLGHKWPEAVLRRRPRLRCIPHTKRNEMGGKFRAIYGVDTEHYLISCHYTEVALAGLRSALGLGGEGERSPERVVWSTAIQTNSTRAVKGSWDYANFNMQHSIENIKLVYRSIADCIRGCTTPDVADEYREELEWLGTSLENGEIFDHSTGTWFTPKHGLLSGVRDTTLINTILNRVYVRAVNQEADERGITRAFNVNCHGDDVIMDHTSVTDGWAWQKLAMSMGFKASPHKCLVAKGRAEYLRNYFRNGHCGGQLGRALTSWVLENWDTREITPILELTNNMVNQGRLMVSRGANLHGVILMGSDAIKFWGRGQVDNTMLRVLQDSYKEVMENHLDIEITIPNNDEIDADTELAHTWAGRKSLTQATRASMAAELDELHMRGLTHERNLLMRKDITIMLQARARQLGGAERRVPITYTLGVEGRHEGLVISDGLKPTMGEYVSPVKVRKAPKQKAFTRLVTERSTTVRGRGVDPKREEKEELWLTQAQRVKPARLAHPLVVDRPVIIAV